MNKAPAKTIEVTPGSNVDMIQRQRNRKSSEDSVPKIGIFRWKPVAIDKTGKRLYQRVFEELPRWANIADVPDLIKLPIARDSLRRLAIGEFVDSARPSPGILLISVESLLSHLDRMQREPEFWLQPNNAQRWKESRKALYRPDMNEAKTTETDT